MYQLSKTQKEVLKRARTIVRAGENGTIRIGVQDEDKNVLNTLTYKIQYIDAETIYFDFIVDEEADKANYRKVYKRAGINNDGNERSVMDRIRRSYKEIEEHVNDLNSKGAPQPKEEEKEEEAPKQETPKQEAPQEQPKQEAPQPPTAPAAPAAPKVEIPTNLGLDAMLSAVIGQQVTAQRGQVLDIVNKYLSDNGIKPNVIHHEIIRPDASKAKIEKAHHLFETILKTCQAGLFPYLFGESGTGKSFIAEQIAEALGLEFYSTSINAAMPPEQLLGYFDSIGGKYRYSEFVRAFENGGVCLLDELDNGNTNTTAGLNQAIANRYLRIEDGSEEGKRIAMHKDFVLISTGNTNGTGATANFSGRQPLDGGLKDRLTYIPYDYDNELKTIICDDDLCKTFHEYRKQARELNMFNVQVTTRTIIAAQKLINIGIEKEAAIDLVLFNKLGEDDTKLLKKSK